MSEDGILKILDSEFRDTIPENTILNSDGALTIHGIELNPIEVLYADQAAYTTARSKWISDKISDARSYVDDIGHLKKDLIRKRIDDLSRAINSSSIIPFVGSGMSADCGLPTWGEFLEDMRMIADIDDDEYIILLNSGKYEVIASKISEKINLDLTEELMVHTFGLGRNDAIRGPIRVLPLLFEGSVITTNYDNIIEKTYNNSNIGFDSTLSGSQLKEYTTQKRLGSRVLAKIHGDYRYLGTRVLTENEYQRNYSSGRRFRVELGRIYRSQGLLFIGCSLNSDRTMEVFGAIPRRERLVNHYALLPLPNNQYGYIDEDTITRRERDLTGIGIFPIWYSGDHSQAIEHIFFYLLSEKGII